MTKNGNAFWQCWRSKFDSKGRVSQVEGRVDSGIIADKFVSHFESTISCNNPDRATSLQQEYQVLRVNYCGLPMTESHKFDTELVSSIIMQLQRGKAVDIVGLSAEHLQFSHPFVCVILAKLFNLMIACSFVPRLRTAIAKPLRVMTVEELPSVRCCPKY